MATPTATTDTRTSTIKSPITEYVSLCNRGSESASSELETSNTVHDAELSGSRKVPDKCLCPCCGEIRALTQTFGPKINAIAVADVPDIAQTLKQNGIAIGEGGNSSRLCNACRIVDLPQAESSICIYLRSLCQYLCPCL